MGRGLLVAGGNELHSGITAQTIDGVGNWIALVPGHTEHIADTFFQQAAYQGFGPIHRGHS
jgi:hypothetical protein